MSVDAPVSRQTYSDAAWRQIGNVLAIRLSILQVFLVTAGSQWGMLILGYLFVTRGRENLAVTPELLVGSLVIFLALVSICLFRVGSFANRTVLFVMLLFLLFLLSGMLGEMAGGFLHLRNLASYAVLACYVIAGSTCGYFICKQSIGKQNKVLLLVFFGWYAGMLLLALSGHLSYSRILTGAASLPRLEFEGGYTATEIPVAIGGQLPFALMLLLGPFGKAAKACGWVLLALILLVLGLTASAGAIVASALVAAIFFAHGSPAVRKRLVIGSAVGLILAVAFGGFFFQELYGSVVQKLASDSESSARVLVYYQIVGLITESPMAGIGKGQFQFYNNFGDGGKGLFPHNNFLGIAVELGLSAMIFYILFIVFFFKVSFRNVKKLRLQGFEAQAYLLLAITGVMTYQQARGFLHDTWTVKELYFWVGYGLGIIAAADRLIRAPKDRVIEKTGRTATQATNEGNLEHLTESDSPRN